VDNTGGGIYNAEGGTVEVTHSTFSGNTADFGGGLGNLGIMTVTKSTISGNTTLTGGGGGIDNSGSLTILDTTISGNSSPESEGGGISINNGGSLNLIGSTISGNTSGNWGGGIAVIGGGLTLTNSTLFNNTAVFGGGIGNNNTSTTSLTHATISGNNAAASNQGGGIYNEGTLTITNTIAANTTTGGDCFNNGGTITPVGVNLVEDGTCTLANAVAGDPLLGGPTSQPAYLPLLAGSPAIDVGANANCAAIDQRGEIRPQDGNNDGIPVCDVGAFELGIITNGGFEAGTTGWTLNTPATDKVKCDKPTKQFANYGQCAFQFTGAPGINNKITQTIVPTLLAGDSLQLRLFYFGKGDAVSGKAKLKVKYTDGTPTGKVILPLSSSDEYLEKFDDVLISSAAISKLKLQISNNSPSGKLYIDDVSLAQNASTLQLLPLP
ncbi:MAG TPA: choice-of-anchor Q domain-containing protein, partial [Phototrophicaceae bacterium]|nr:choice-of-anchor Q domain-containing protein [Phototrophicaceae bacterium]